MSVAAVAAVATVGIAGYSAYSSSKAQSKQAKATKAAGKATIAKDLNAYVTGMNTELPTIIGGEEKYRPKFQGLNLGDMNAFINGTGGQQGLIGAGGQAQTAAQGQLNAGRAGEFANMQSNTGNLRGILDSMSPEAAGMVARSNHAAEQAYQSSQGMTGQEMRSSDQLARESFAARGRINDNGAVASELLGRDDVMERKRREAMMQGQNAYGQSQAFYSQPGLQMLGATPASMGLGQSYLGMGMGAIGQGTPQLYDTGAALNQGAMNRQNQFNASAANYAASSAQRAGTMGMIGNVVGPAITAVGNYYNDRSTANAPKATIVPNQY